MKHNHREKKREGERERESKIKQYNITRLKRIICIPRIFFLLQKYSYNSHFTISKCLL